MVIDNQLASADIAVDCILVIKIMFSIQKIVIIA